VPSRDLQRERRSFAVVRRHRAFRRRFLASLAPPVDSRPDVDRASRAVASRRVARVGRVARSTRFAIDDSSALSPLSRVVAPRRRAVMNRRVATRVPDCGEVTARRRDDATARCGSVASRRVCVWFGRVWFGFITGARRRDPIRTPRSRPKIDRRPDR
jgi:hypothetical protein